MSQSGLLLSNYPSLLLNYLIFISKINDKKNQKYEEGFQLFNTDETTVRLDQVINAWDLTLENYSIKNPIYFDSALYNNKKINQFLFPHSDKNLDPLLKIFLFWWELFPCGGRSAIELLSNPLIDKLYNEIILIPGMNEINKKVTLLLVYDTSNDFHTCNETQLVIPINDLLSSQKSLNNTAKKIAEVLLQ